MMAKPNRLETASPFSLPKLIIWGASGHALVVADIVRLQQVYQLVGFLDDLNPHMAGREFADARILGGREQLKALAQEGMHLLLGFGNCEARLQLAQLAVKKGFLLAVAVHPRSILAADATIGAGTVVAAGAILNPGCRIGENVIVNTGAIVDHECVIEDGVHLCPGVKLAGNVRIGRGSWIGIGTTIINGVRVGAGTMIGAGAVVVNDIPDGVVAYGVPAKVVRKTEVKKVND